MPEVSEPTLESAHDAEDVALLRVALNNMQASATYWQERCARYEAHHERLEQSAADVRGAVEQFLVVLQHARPQGTDKRASEER